MYILFDGRKKFFKVFLKNSLGTHYRVQFAEIICRNYLLCVFLPLYSALFFICIYVHMYVYIMNSSSCELFSSSRKNVCERKLVCVKVGVLVYLLISHISNNNIDDLTKEHIKAQKKKHIPFNLLNTFRFFNNE